LTTFGDRVLTLFISPENKPVLVLEIASDKNHHFTGTALTIGEKYSFELQVDSEHNYIEFI